MADDFDVVLLIEQALGVDDAQRVTSLHEGLDEAVTFHVLVPMEDAAAQIESSMGSLWAGEMMAAPSVGLGDVDLEAVRKDCAERSNAELEESVTQLERAGGTVASSCVITGPPIDALADKVAEVDAREAIILTRPHVVAEFFHVDWTSKARRKIGVPVLHLLEHESPSAQTGGGEGVTGV